MPACFAKAVCDRPVGATSSHGQIRHVPDGGQPLPFGVQIHAPVGIVRDAEGETLLRNAAWDASGSAAILKVQLCTLPFLLYSA